MRHPVYPHIFQPLTVRHVTFKNRIFCAPSLAHQTQYTQASSPETPYLLHYVERAKGGERASVVAGNQWYVPIRAKSTPSWRLLTRPAGAILFA